MATSDIRLSVAEERTIYDVADIERALEDPAVSRNEALTALYEKMRQRGGGRFLIRPNSPDMIDGLYESCPNFREVIDDLRKYIALSVAGSEPMSFTPLLLLGEPGVGKTHFAKELAHALGTGHEFVSMNSLTAGWILSGASSQWNNAKPGKVGHTLVHGEFANPVVVLDEVDKAGGDSRYDPLGALYGLLEQETASRFKDEFIDIDMDASHILWVSTANDERGIPEPILNRMNIYEVARPDREAARSIAAALYRAIVAEHDWGFPPEADDEVLDCLAGMPPRNMKKRLLAALGSAKLDGRDHLESRDLNAAPAGRTRKIGF
ncbi:MAG: ATPase, central region [Rhodocyclaceae bacterium]|nr:ATPase, central region [Rhodocyclaceae bacterium]